MDVVNGVKDAQEATEAGTIVPEGSLREPWVSLGVTKVQTVEFEVVVTTEESTGKDAKIGIVSGILSGGVSGKSASDSSNQSKLKIRVPVCFPTSGPIARS